MLEHVVQVEEIDPLGHANNIAYLEWMQAAAIGHSAAQGWSGEGYRERGWAWVVRSHAIEYRLPAVAGDRIEVRTWVCDMRRFTSRRKYALYRGESLLARAETNWAFVNVQTGRLAPIPPEVSQAFELLTE
jgi:acyl-CoA thioester hydrolase